MPANLTQQYLAAEAEFRAAREPEARIEALELMLRVIPKHKGTEHLRGQLRKKLKQLREEKQQAQKGGATRRVDLSMVERHGAGQVALLGPANSGKSAVLAALTNAEPEVASYPFTTQRAQPGMMAFDDVQIQLIDCPPIGREYYSGWMSSLVRRADAALVVLDSAIAGVLDDVEAICERLEASKIRLEGFFGAADAAGGDEAPDGELDDDDILARLEPGVVERPCVALANKMDLTRQQEDFEVLAELLEDRFELLPVSAQTGVGLEPVPRLCFDMLGLIRVYTKRPGRPPDMHAPNVVSRGTTIARLARTIHKDLARNLTYARIWGRRFRDGQRVPRDAVLEDCDVVELRG